MYILELTFECYRDTSLGEAERAIVHYLDMLRYQGQILGGPGLGPGFGARPGFGPRPGARRRILRTSP